MKKSFYKFGFVGLATLVLWLVVPADDARSFSAGAPAGYCNSPASPGSTCFTCHSSGPSPITIPGMITSNIPLNGYVAGSTYTITATVNGQGHNRFGFEITPQDLSGNLVGSMNDLGPETMFQQSGMYITHSSNSLLNNDSKTWQFEWTAPAAGSGSVTFYGAFNITNNDGSYTGDTVVLSTSTFYEDSGLSVTSLNPGNITSVYLSSGSLVVRNCKAEVSTIRLFDCYGKEVWSSETYPGDRQDEMKFELPLALSRGIYIVQMEGYNYRWAQKIVNSY
jgi:hypothetical protein